MNDLNFRTYFASVILFAIFLGALQMNKPKFEALANHLAQQSFRDCEMLLETPEINSSNQQVSPESVVAYWPARTLPLKEIRIYAIPFNAPSKGYMSVRTLMNSPHIYNVRLDHPRSLERFRESISSLRVSRESKNLDHRVACLLIYEDGSKELMGMDSKGNIFLSGIKFERSESMYHLLTTWIPASYYR